MDAIGTFLSELLIDPVRLPLMQRAFLAVIVIGAISGVMGAFVVTRGLAFLGDALAHTILPGVAIAYLTTGGNPGAVFVGGVAGGVASGVVIGLLTRGGRLKEDTAIGVVFAGALALGIGIISRAQNYSTDLTHILIGNVLAISTDELIGIAGVAVVVLAIVIALYKELLIVSFDPTLVQTLRLPGERLRIGLLVLLALTVVISLQAVGVAMVAALLVTPAATARFFVRRLHHLMALAALIGAGGSVLGLYVTWHARIAPSAGIVLTLTAFFIVAYAWDYRQRRAYR